MNKKVQERYIKQLKEDCFKRDIRQNHVNADNILCELLVELGYQKVVKVFNETERRYA